MKRTWLRWLVPLFLLCALAVSSAQAQLFNNHRRWPPPEPEESHRLLAVPYAVGIVLAIPILVIVCMPSRKHT
jgi:hypothetical protein